jgi:hypothetical protein
VLAAGLCKNTGVPYSAYAQRRTESDRCKSLRPIETSQIYYHYYISNKVFKLIIILSHRVAQALHLQVAVKNLKEEEPIT